MTNTEQSAKVIDAPPMKTLIATIILGWVAVVTFAGPDLAKFIDRVLPDEPVKAKVVNRRHR